MFKLLCRKSSEEATKERQMFFNLLKDAQVLLVVLTVFVEGNKFISMWLPSDISPLLRKFCHCVKQAVPEISLMLGDAILI